jgi:hypothetical protein
MGWIIQNGFTFRKGVDVDVASLTALCRNLAGRQRKDVLKSDLQLINKLKNIKYLQVSNTTIISAIFIIIIIIIIV